MSDLTRYRIRNGDPCAAMANLGVTGELQHERSCFVEDSTLQDIADTDWLALGRKLSLDGPNWMEEDAEAKYAIRVRDTVLSALGLDALDSDKTSEVLERGDRQMTFPDYEAAARIANEIERGHPFYTFNDAVDAALGDEELWKLNGNHRMAVRVWPLDALEGADDE